MLNTRNPSVAQLYQLGVAAGERWMGDGEGFEGQLDISTVLEHLFEELLSNAVLTHADMTTTLDEWQCIPCENYCTDQQKRSASAKKVYAVPSVDCVVTHTEVNSHWILELAVNGNQTVDDAVQDSFNKIELSHAVFTVHGSRPLCSDRVRFSSALNTAPPILAFRITNTRARATSTNAVPMFTRHSLELDCSDLVSEEMTSNIHEYGAPKPNYVLVCAIEECNDGTLRTWKYNHAQSQVTWYSCGMESGVGDQPCATLQQLLELRSVSLVLYELVGEMTVAESALEPAVSTLVRTGSWVREESGGRLVRMDQ